MGKTDATDSADPPDPIFVVVQWSSSEPKFSKISLEASASSWTLAKFKAHAAAVLQVEHLQLPDFNEEGLDRTKSLHFLVPQKPGPTFFEGSGQVRQQH